jgi:hypothetical protein
MLGGAFCYRRPSGDAAAFFLRRSLVRVAARDLLPSMIARTDLVQGDGSQYMKVVCTPSRKADERVAEVEARKAALR